MPGCHRRCGPPRSARPPVRTGAAGHRDPPGRPSAPARDPAARPHRPAARPARRLADPALRLGALRTADLDVGHVLGSALRARPHGERALAGVPASPSRGGRTAAETGGEAGLFEDTAEELLERLVEGAPLETAGRTADKRLTAAGWRCSRDRRGTLRGLIRSPAPSLR
ncbi:hypothetical protein ACFYZ2_13465 [Streptomyces sviceus]|uniref:hypothetical protein n=1 Tax=Streptomyces sviceus TaxID=285530 RepID=UPI0036B236BA